MRSTIPTAVMISIFASVIGGPSLQFYPAYGQAVERVWVCYPIVSTINPPAVRLQDQFGNETVDLTPGILLCGFATKNAAEPPTTIFWMKQYLYTGTIDPPRVNLTDQFGSDTVDIGLSTDMFEQAAVNFQPPEIEVVYWKSYPALGLIDPPQVDVKGAFGNETLNPGPAVALLVPAIKNGGGSEELLHYRCYSVSGQIDPPQVVLGDTYGSETVDPLPASLLCIPTDKQLIPDEPAPVGGELLSVDAIPLFVAGAYANASWIIPLAGITAAGIIGFVIRKLRQEQNDV